MILDTLRLVYTALLIIGMLSFFPLNLREDIDAIVEKAQTNPKKYIRIPGLQVTIKLYIAWVNIHILQF